jgi:hypothetical protein
VTITPLQLEIAPPNTQPDLVNGGARVTVRVSGLDPHTSVENLGSFDAVTVFGPQTPPYTVFSTGHEQTGPGHVAFEAAPAIAAVVPTGEWAPTTGATPKMPLSDDILRASQQTVGKSGEIELQIILFGPLKVSVEKPTTMTFTRLPIAIVQPDGTVLSPLPLLGHWQFQIPLASA